jgi:hypothetical protein
MALSKAKSASMAAMKQTSPPVVYYFFNNLIK